MIKELKLTNFKCFPNVTLKGIPEGLIIIQGETSGRSNSFGKTSLVEAIMVAFFGSEATGLKLNDLITFKESRAEIRVLFTIEGNEYLLIRLIKRGSRGGTAPFKLFKKEGTKFKEIPKDDLAGLLQINSKQALGTVFVRQGEIESLANAKPAELRKEIIRLFRLDITKSVENYLITKKREVETKYKRIQREFRNPTDIESEIQEETEELEKEKKEVESLNHKLEELRKKRKAYPNLNDIQRLNDLRQKIRNYRQMMKKVQTEINDFKAEISIDGNNYREELERIQFKIEKL
ncbi:MAG: AAA family ATPase, partial [Candidatus Helarchaeales archaeon]